jgi:hypothetical protein
LLNCTKPITNYEIPITSPYSLTHYRFFFHNRKICNIFCSGLIPIDLQPNLLLCTHIMSNVTSKCVLYHTKVRYSY